MKYAKDRRKLYSAGTKVRFHFQWFGRSNVHDGHLCIVVKSWIERGGKDNRAYHKYILEDIEKEIAVRAKRKFKITDTSTYGTWLTLT